jgi:NhaA family Na+:H+ antiporter
VAICAGLVALSRRAREADLPLYAIAGVALWYCLLRGGINADIAGVVTAMALPTPALAAGADADAETLLDRLHHALSPWTSLLVMPIFALANTAVALSASSLATLLSAPVAQGIALGLFVGKPLGIVAFSLVRVANPRTVCCEAVSFTTLPASPTHALPSPTRPTRSLASSWAWPPGPPAWR